MSLLKSSIVLYLNPDFLGNRTITSIVGIVFGVIGFYQLIIELSNSANPLLKDAQNDIGAAALIGIILFLLHYFFSHWAVNIVIIFLLVCVSYAFLRGLLKIMLVVQDYQINYLLKVPIVILNLAIFTLTILQLLQIFKVIEK